MAYTQAGGKAVQKYNAKTYDQIKVIVKKGQRDIIKNHATVNGESLNGFILRSINECMERDTMAGNNAAEENQND